MLILQAIFLIAIFLNLLLSLFVLSQNPKSSNNRLFSLFSFIAAIWVFTNYMTGIVATAFWAKSTYAFGALVIGTGLVWITIATKKKLSKIELSAITIVAVFFFLISFKSGFLVSHYSQIYFGGVFTGTAGYGLFIYTFFYLLASLLIILRLFKAQKNADKLEQRMQFRYILFGALIVLIITALSSFILPIFSIFIFGGVDSISFLFFLALIAYSILRHHLFDIKVVAIETITFSLWIFIFIRTLLANTVREAAIEAGVLCITIIFGIILIRTVLTVISQRQKIETLAADLKSAYTKVQDTNEHLEQKVAEQTKQIREAYEVEKQARHELEMLNEAKDQFIMITQHHLRTPLTTIRWQIEEMLKGTHGKINPELKIALTQTNEATNKLTHIINDFLNITAAKAGTKILNVSPASLLPVLEKSLLEQKEVVDQREITITYNKELNNWPELPIDATKMEEVVSILIENAITYNENGGVIEITSQKNESGFEFIVKSSGPYIHEEAQTKIFKELFYRSKEAQKINPTGMGVGLIVAKSIVAAHKGKIEISNSLLSTKKPCVMVKITLPLR